MFIKPN